MNNQNDSERSENVQQDQPHLSDGEYKELEDDAPVFSENLIRSSISAATSLKVGDAEYMSVESMSLRTPGMGSDEDSPNTTNNLSNSQSATSDDTNNLSNSQSATLDDTNNLSKSQSATPNNTPTEPKLETINFETVNSEDVHYLGQVDLKSGKIITDPKQILEFAAKMPELSSSSSSSSNDQEKNKFPIPMNPNGNVSVIELDSSSEENDKSFSVIENNSSNTSTSPPPFIINSDNNAQNELQSPGVVEFMEDEDSTQYEDMGEDDIVEVVTSTVNNFVGYTHSEKDDDDDEFIEETIAERLWGLTEMFPECVVDGTINAIENVKSLTGYLFNKSKCGIWIAVSAFVVFAFPVVIGVETIRMDETQLAQQRQMLVNSGALNSQPGSLEPSPIPA